jgi:Zn-finger nucleic acid-binding protein
MLETFNRHGGGDAPSIEADMCLSCGGLWLDGGEAAAAYPGLAALEDRRGDVLAAGDAAAAIPACLRCSMPAVLVPFFDVKLDVCTGCYGVWIDGDEIEALSRAMDRSDGFPVPPEIVGGYRTAAAGVMTKHIATCVTCGKQVPFRASRATPKGAMCEACADELDAAAIRAGKTEEDEEYVVPVNSGVWGLVCDIGQALGAVLLASARCAHCGCRNASRCRC